MSNSIATNADNHSNARYTYDQQNETNQLKTIGTWTGGRRQTRNGGGGNGGGGEAG